MNKTTSIWQDVSENDNGVYAEAPLDKLVNSDCKVGKCCETPDLWFQRIEVSPVTDYFVVLCKSCGETSKPTDWSWERAIAIWSIGRWNPKYMGRNPLKLADDIEALDLEQLTLKDLDGVFAALKRAPTFLRSLVEEAEEQRISPFMLPNIDVE